MPGGGVEVAVVISDTFGRAWRLGLTDVAIGVAGLAAVVDLRGTRDATGRRLQVTEVAVADEVAGAADLVMGKSQWHPGGDRARPRRRASSPRVAPRDLVRAPDEDLFR